MPTRSNKDYLLAATKGNGSKSMNVNYPRISLTPGPPPPKGQVGNGGSNPPNSAPTVSNAAQQHFQQPTSQPPPSALKTPTVGKTITFSPPNQQQSQTANLPSSVSRVNRGARKRPVLATLGPSQGDDVIDYSSSEGQKTYKRATAALKDEYDGTSEGLTVFRIQLNQKAANEGWANGTVGDCINVPIDGEDPSNGFINIIHERTQVTEELIQLWANNEIVQQSIEPTMVNRRAQNNKNMVETITNSLSKGCLARLGLKHNRYTIGGVVIGALLFKVLLEGAELETMVTSANIRQGLQESEKVLSRFGNDVSKYVEFVRESLQKLHDRGETTNEHDLMISLFRAFKGVTDATFRDHFKTEELMWFSGKREYTVESLLSDAEIMYKVKEDNGLWGKKTQEEEDLIAMKAEFKDLNLKFSEEKKKYKKLRKQSASSGASGSGQSRKPWLRPGEEWKLENPENKKMQKREGKTWYWCLNHNDGKGMWTLHKPADCRQRQRQERASASSSSNAQDQAMPAVEESESESDSEDSDY